MSSQISAIEKNLHILGVNVQYTIREYFHIQCSLLQSVQVQNRSVYTQIPFIWTLYTQACLFQVSQSLSILHHKFAIDEHTNHADKPVTSNPRELQRSLLRVQVKAGTCCKSLKKKAMMKLTKKFGSPCSGEREEKTCRVLSKGQCEIRATSGPRCRDKRG